MTHVWKGGGVREDAFDRYFYRYFDRRFINCCLHRNCD
jgi:hypothetical protein